MNEKQKEQFEVIQTAIAREEEGEKAYDPEKDGTEVPHRPLLLWHAGVIGLAMVLVVIVEFACIAKLLTEVRLDGTYIRFGLILTVPVFAAFSLFFMIVITGSLFQIFGPLASIQENSMFYSAKAPKPGRHTDYELPHVTIQMPVYKEGLKGVIMPTIESCMAAVRFYESRGGTASIFINDDGMQLVKPELAEAHLLEVADPGRHGGGVVEGSLGGEVDRRTGQPEVAAEAQRQVVEGLVDVVGG